MSFWNRIINTISGADNRSGSSLERSYYASHYCFVDVEVGVHDKKIHDIGAVRWDGAVYHAAGKPELMTFLKNVDFICGHNIIHHDVKYLFGKATHSFRLVDTLFLSPLLFPERPYHRLVKDDKLVTEQLNNPVNDCEKARDLLMDEVARWERLPDSKKIIFATLLQDIEEFKGFLAFVNAKVGLNESLTEQIRLEYKEEICQHADIESAIQKYPLELAYALALIDTTDYRSITPEWGT